MNTRKITWFGLVLLLCAISTQVFARPYGNPPRGGPGGGGGGKQWHKSHSGKIDTPREQKAFGKYDKNDDGKLGPKEHKYMDLDEKNDPRDAQWQKSHSGQIDTPLEEKKLGEYDKNDDGKLGPKERDYMHDDLNKDATVGAKEKYIDNHNGAGNHPKPPIKDVNGDGTIDDTDRKIMIKSHVNNPNEAKMDANNDHHVSKEELDAAKEVKSGDSETEGTSE